MSPLAALVAGWVITALWPLVGASGLRHFGTLPLLCGGLAVGLAALSPFLAARGRWRALVSREAAPSFAAMGLLSGVAGAVYVHALAYTSPVNAVIVAQVEVLYSGVLSARLLGERPTLKQAAAALLVVAGTGLIVLRDLRSPRWRGDLMILATPWLFQLSHVVSKRLPKDLDAFTLAGGRAAYGLLALGPLCALSLARGARWSAEPGALLLLLLQGVLLSSTNFVLWYAAIRGMELAKATTFLLSYPALTLLFSWALGREEVGAAQVAGLACTFAGAAWTARLTLARREAAGVESRG